MKNLALRMYFFVPNNISEIQKGIQAGHGALEYAREYGNTELFKDFINNHKTWIILNGGTTNESKNNPGSLQQIYNEFITYSVTYGYIPFSIFNEPDLNDTMTAICFIADERVFNKELYPDYDNYFAMNCVMPYDSIETIPDGKEEWLHTIGGEKNEFLRKIISGKRLA